MSVLLGYDNGSFADQIKYSTGYDSLSVAVGDLSNDIRVDIVVTNSIGDSVSVLFHHAKVALENEIHRYIVLEKWHT